MLDLLIPGLQFAVIRNNRVINKGALGLANIQDGVPVTMRTVFPINSITKAFTGVALMQLVEANKLDLDAPISRYLDHLPLDWQAVTVRRIVTHTSGLPDVWDEHSNLIASSPAAAWAKVQTLPMDFKPGEKFKYNQTNYVLAGMIIEKLSGKPFDRFIHERQFDVAKMPHTGFFDGNDVIAHGTRSYSVFRTIDGRFTYTRTVTNGIPEEFPEYMRTAAGINTTVNDLCNWIISLKTGRLLRSKGSLRKMWTAGRLTNGTHAAFSPLVNGYGVGWPMVMRDRHPAYSPTGGGRSAFFWYPADDLIIVVLTNLTGGQPDGFIDELASLYIPGLKTSNGFGLLPGLERLRLALGRGSARSVANLIQADKEQVDEIEVNRWGYLLLEEPGQMNAAIRVFQLNTLLFPKSSNAFDSLAEGYERSGKLRMAIENYRYALKLDRSSSHSASRLRILLGRVSSTPIHQK